MECVYLIRHNGTGLHKIGMTANWERRSRELGVGRVTTKIRLVQCKNAEKWERVLQAMFKHRRIPQSEWFQISAEESIPKMEWLAQKTSQPMIVGQWKRAQAGHYYRRRKSSYGNWYTEIKSSDMVSQETERLLEYAIRSVEKQQIQEARSQPGFWPSLNDKTKLEWADRDPTYMSSGTGCLLTAGLGIILLISISSQTWLVVGIAGVGICFVQQKVNH